MKEKPDRKKANSALQHLRTDFRSMMAEERLDALFLVCIHRDIFLHYDKIIDIYASKYPRSKLLKRLTLEKHIKLIKTSAFLVFYRCNL